MTRVPSPKVGLSNLQRAKVAWGRTMPEWIERLAAECDRTNQRAVGERLGVSNGYVSRVLNNKYEGNVDEAEQLIRARLMEERVDCPAFGQIPLTSCMRNRRRKTPAINAMQRAFDRHCPLCPFNTDREED